MVFNHHYVYFLAILFSFLNSSILCAGEEDIRASKKEVILGNYSTPYTILKRNTLEKELYGGIDFWKDDRLNVPSYNKSINILSNPSFEADLKYYTFPCAIGTYQPGYEQKYTIDKTESKFGRASLRISAECPRYSFDCIQSFGYPVDKGEFYTLSFYVKANKPGINLKVSHVPAHIFAKEHAPIIMGDSVFQLSEAWERHNISFKSNSNGYAFSFKPVKNVDGGAMWIDGIQLEKGEKPTEFIQRPVCVALSTSKEGNFLNPEDRINGKLHLKTNSPNNTGSIAVNMQDFFYNITDIGTFSFKTDADGCAEVPLPLDKYTSGKKGLYIIKTITDIEDSKNNVDYSRFSIMNNMNGKHRNKDIFSFHQLVTPNYEKALARLKNIGVGSTNYFFYNNHNKLLFELLKKYDIEDTCALIRQHWGKKLSDGRNSTGNTISIQKNGAADLDSGEILIQGMMEWDEVTPEREKALELAAEKFARTYNWRTNFAFHQEMSGYKILDNGKFDDVAKLLIACSKGVKKASPLNQVYPEGGAINIMSATSLMDNVLTSAKKVDPEFRFDRFAAHAYGHPENEEFDELLQNFFGVLDKHGYSKAPIYINEGGYYSPFCIPEWGLTPYRPLLMDHYHLWGISYDMGWGERISAALAARAWLLALKYQHRIKQFNMFRPFIYLDCDLTPMAIQKVTNTLANLLGNATFKDEISFAAKSKAYIFEDDNKIPIAVIWGYEDKIEQGYDAPLVMKIKSDEIVTEVIDLMENSYEVPSEHKVLELALGPFPVFLKGRKGEISALTKIVKSILVEGETTSPFQVALKLKTSDSLQLEIKNLLTREFNGNITVRFGNDSQQKVLKMSGYEKLHMEIKLENPAVDSQINANSIDWIIKELNGNHYSGRLMLEAFSIKKSQKSITVTGNLSEWDDLPYISVINTKPEQKIPYKNFNAKFKSTWDEKYFYLLVDVTDSKLFYDAPLRNTAEATTCDVLLVYFDTLCNGKAKSTLRVDSDDYYYVFMPRPDEGIAKVWVQEACNQQLSVGINAVKSRTFITDVKTCFKKTDKGYFYEMAFPQITILPMTLEAGSVFGFGLFLMNKDGKESLAQGLTLSYPPGSVCWRSAHLWPQVILEKDR